MNSEGTARPGNIVSRRTGEYFLCLDFIADPTLDLNPKPLKALSPKPSEWPGKLDLILQASTQAGAPLVF